MNINVPCPFHKENDPSCGVDLELDTFYCFGCEKSGRPSRYPELIKLALEYGAHMAYMPSTTTAPVTPVKIVVNRDPSSDRYLLDRGFNHDTLDKFEIGGDDYALYFPVKLRSGETAGVIRRVWENTETRYLNSKGFRRKFYVYGSWLCDASSGVIVVEGPLDCVKMHQLGFTNTVALMGNKLTNEQAALLKKLSTRVTLAMDNDSPGEKARYDMAVRLMKMGCDVKALQYPTKDPGELENSEQVSTVPILGAILG